MIAADGTFVAVSKPKALSTPTRSVLFPQEPGRNSDSRKLARNFEVNTEEYSRTGIFNVVAEKITYNYDYSRRF